jgi:creatinine amidohydrolase
MTDREVHFERLRPAALREELVRCPLVFLPVAPLEYHGPHLPVGTDPINATQCALATCRRLGKGVVMPTLYWGTERERPGWLLESLGFDKGEWIVGMDFPTATWKSHYYPEHVFALVVASQVEMLIAQGYKIIVIVNGHGAMNQQETLDRLAGHYSHTTDAAVVWRLSFGQEMLEKKLVGHADLYETSLMMFFEQEIFGGEPLVDLSSLPPRNEPIRYPDLSIVDAPGFSESPSPGRVVLEDPRDATAEEGKALFEDTVRMYLELTEQVLKEKGF